MSPKKIRAGLHPLQASRQPGPGGSDTSDSIDFILERANDVLDLVAAGKLLTHPPDMPEHLNNESCKRLTKEEQLFLAERYQTYGCVTARNRLVNSLDSYVKSEAYKFSKTVAGKPVGIDALIQAGRTGTLRAVEDYNPRLGWNFTTYAFNWIYAKMQRAAQAEDKHIRAPIEGMPLVFDEAKNRRARPKQKLCSINDLVNNSADGEPAELGDNLADASESAEAYVAEEQTKSRVRQVMLASLASFTKNKNAETQVIAEAVINHRILADEPANLSDIGKMFGVSREWVRLVEAGLLKQFRAKAGLAFPDRAPASATA